MILNPEFLLCQVYAANAKSQRCCHLYNFIHTVNGDIRTNPITLVSETERFTTGLTHYPDICQYSLHNFLPQILSVVNALCWGLQSVGYADSRWVWSVWSAREKSLEIRCHYVQATERTDSGLYSFAYWAILTDLQIHPLISLMEWNHIIQHNVCVCCKFVLSLDVTAT